MTPLQIAGSLAHSTSSAYRKKLQALRAFCAENADDTCYVSFSAGKDSAVIAHAMHEARPGIPVLMVDPGCPTHWTADDRDMWITYAASAGWALKLFAWDKWGVVDATPGGDEKQKQDAIHKDMFHDLHAHADAHGLTTRIMGLRASESNARYMLVAKRGLRYDYKAGGAALLPIAQWSTADVWAYIHGHKLPWLDIYSKLGPDARNGIIGVSGHERGRLELLKIHYPEAWAWAAKNQLI